MITCNVNYFVRCNKLCSCPIQFMEHLSGNCFSFTAHKCINRQLFSNTYTISIFIRQFYFTLLLYSPSQQLNSCDWPSFDQGNVQGRQLSKVHWSLICNWGLGFVEHFTVIKVTILLCRYIWYTGWGLYYGCYGGILWGNRYNRVCGYVPCLEMSSEYSSNGRGQQSRYSTKDSLRIEFSLCWPLMCCVETQISTIWCNKHTSKSIMSVILQHVVTAGIQTLFPQLSKLCNMNNYKHRLMYPSHLCDNDFFNLSLF